MVAYLVMAGFSGPAVLLAFPYFVSSFAVQEADVGRSLDVALHQECMGAHPLDQKSLLVGGAGGFDFNVVEPQGFANVGGRRPRAGARGPDALGSVWPVIMGLEGQVVQ